MRKLISFMHASLDNCVCGPEGELDWIAVDPEIFRFADRVAAESDIALYGRRTYEMMQAYWPSAGSQPEATEHEINHSRWYNSVQKVVLSKTVGPAENPGVTIISDNIREKIKALKKEGNKNIVVFGSPGTVNALIDRELVDELWLFLNPVVLGRGMRLFREGKKVDLKLLDTHRFKNDVLCLRYFPVY